MFDRAARSWRRITSRSAPPRATPARGASAGGALTETPFGAAFGFAFRIRSLAFVMNYFPAFP